MKPLLALSLFVMCVAPLDVLAIENSSEKRIAENVEKSLNYFSGEPVAVLVEDSKQVVEEARAFLNRLSRRNTNPDFWLFKYNKTGVSEILAKASDGEGTFFNQLRSTTSATNFLGLPEDSGGVVTFFSILKAAQLLPPETAILLFTQHRAEDEDLAQLAAKELKRQRIKLFIIWMGGKRGDEKLLREVSSETVGLFYMESSEKKRSEAYFANPQRTKAKSIVHLEKGIKDHKLIYFPIDTYVTAIHLSLDGVSEAKLTTPRALCFGVLDSSEVTTFSEGSFVTTTNQELGQYEVELRIESTSDVGMWSLDVNGIGDASALRRRDANTGYDVAVFAETDLTATVALVNGKLAPKPR